MNTNGAADIYTVCVTDPTRAPADLRLQVEKGTPGFRIGKVEDKMGIRCVPVVEIEFDNCRVPAENLLGGKAGYGFKHAMMTLDRARPGVAAQGVGLAAGALELASVYANRRIQFGAKISSFQMIQQMLADMAIKVEAARQLVHAAARAVDEEAPDQTKMAAMSKCFATDVAMEVTTQAVQVFGGYGYMRDYPIEKYMRTPRSPRSTRVRTRSKEWSSPGICEGVGNWRISKPIFQLSSAERQVADLWLLNRGPGGGGS